ncbi:MAG: hypothetical protein IPG14_10355 [Dehalococcoidia bacterium]|nr:hypothetical protein [Dehalococcoidia bacterium]
MPPGPAYAAFNCYIDNWRWQGVPFYLRSGKVLPAKKSRSSSSSTARPT